MISPCFYLRNKKKTIEINFIYSYYKLLRGDSMTVKRTAILLRLRPEDREVIRQLARYYDIAEADVVKILIREYMKNHKIDVGSSSSS